MVGIAGNYPDPNNVHGEPVTAVSVTYIPDYSWPLWHHAFDRDDLTGLWWYAPAVQALPALRAALERMDPASVELAALAADDWRGVRGNALVLARIIQDLQAYPGSVIAWGRE